MKHLTPLEAAAFLQADPNAVFVDCRSESEYYFVGHPVGAHHVAWVDGPEFEANPHFLADVRKLAAHSNDRPVLLICRSGKRSIDAGVALENAGFSNVYNVLHGFEGDLNTQHQRGKLNGWRFDGLPWEQM
jgi:rhodanese-related sulfurtransferase